MLTTLTGEVDRGAVNGCGAALKMRTNIANRGRSSGQEGRRAWWVRAGGRRCGKALTVSASTATSMSSAGRKRSTAGWVKAIERGQRMMVGQSAEIQGVRNEVLAAIRAMKHKRW
eukprot:scaffold10558_cov92-Amphora_coffeaeformis.AAC.1